HARYYNILPTNHLYVFFKEPTTTEIYTLSLHDALPISHEENQVKLVAYKFHGGVLAWWDQEQSKRKRMGKPPIMTWPRMRKMIRDRKSTRLNSSHVKISYAVFCLKKKKKTINNEKLNIE